MERIPIPVSHQPFVVELAEKIIQGLLNAHSLSCSRSTPNRQKYIRAAQDYIDAHIDSPLRINDVYQALSN